MSLNPRQERFAAEYLVDLNATQAAIRAGYAPRAAGQQAHELLKIPEIQARITAARAELQARTEVSQDWVIRTLKTNAERAAQAEPVRDAEGNPTGEYTYQGAVVNRASELIGKHLGMFTDKVDVTSQGDKLSAGVFAAILEAVRAR